MAQNGLARGAAAAIVAFALGACGEDDKKNTDDQKDDPQTDAGTTDEQDSGTHEELPPHFVLATQVNSGDTFTTYIVDSETIEIGELSLDDALVMPGRAVVAAPGEGGVFFVGSDSGPKVTRYSLDEANEPVEGPAVNFEATGISAITEYQSLFQFVSETKAYYFDGATTQAVVWDPAAMKVTSTINLKELASKDHIVAFSSMPTWRGQELIMPVGFRSLDNTKIVGGAAAVIIDTTDDSFVIARDDRCGYVRDAVTEDDGTVYLATEAYGSAVHRMAAANAPEPCLLRIPSGEKAFDEDFHVALNPLADGKTVGSLIRLPSGNAYVHVLDETLADVASFPVARALASAAAWSWSEIALGDSPTLTPSSLPAMSGSIIAFHAEDTVLAAEFLNRGESTKLRNLSDGSGDEVVSSAGNLFSLAQVR